MKHVRISSTRHSSALILVMLMVAACSRLASGDTHYVNLDSTNPVPPYTSWKTAAAGIQDAMGTATNGDSVLVTNGTYEISAEIRIIDGIRVQSVNGPMRTIVMPRRYRWQHRIFYLAHSNAVVEGFTISGGDATRELWPDDRGGGVFCDGGGTVKNCVITDNHAYEGGGVYLYFGGIVRNCLVEGNHAAGGGGIFCDFGGLVQNCTVVANNADGGAGLSCWHGGTVENSIIYSNTTSDFAESANYTNFGTGWTYTSCCTIPSITGGNNFTNNPQFLSTDMGDYRLSSASPCIDTGTNQTWMAGAIDVSGNPRIASWVVDIGAYEFGPLCCGFAANETEGAYPLFSEFQFTAYVAGTNAQTLYYWWDFNNDGIVEAEGMNQQVTSHTYTNVGCYSVFLSVSNAAGETATSLHEAHITVGATRYVSPSGSHTCPYTNWATAATNIHAAVSVSNYEGAVLVTDGTYETSAEISIPIPVLSVNGPEMTIVRRNGATNHRIFSLYGSYALLEGFTIMNGHPVATASPPFPPPLYVLGGGVYCSEGTVRNCVIKNSLADSGGGVYCYRGTIQGCTITGNSTEGWPSGGDGGGVYCVAGTVTDCTLEDNSSEGDGGGAYCSGGGAVQNCVISSNSAGYGGGVYCHESVAENCTISENSAVGSTWLIGDPGRGGGVYSFNGAVRNCTVTGNSANDGRGFPQWPPAPNPGEGGGLYCSGTVIVQNSILYANNASSGTNFYPISSDSSYTYCCTTPMPPGEGNITSDPQLTITRRLKYESPCIDAASSNSLLTDIDGEERWDDPRHTNTVSSWDIGADEFVDIDLDGMADCWEMKEFGATNRNGTADGDNDELTNREEYENSTHPNDEDSDDDGLRDGDEVNTYATNPMDWDSDDDQMSDGWEASCGLDPKDPYGSNGPDGDPDADGANNMHEYAADTLPTNANSVLLILAIRPQYGGMRLDWKGGVQAWQFLECRENLRSTDEQWKTILGIPPPTPINNAVIDMWVTNRVLFYRIRAGREEPPVQDSSQASVLSANRFFFPEDK